MSTTQISKGELAVGQFITILRWHPWEVTHGGFFNDGPVVTKMHEDHSWCGDVLKVEAVQLPYVVVSHPHDPIYSSPTRLDTRRVDLMELSPEYVKAAARPPRPA